MYAAEEAWCQVDEYLADQLGLENESHREARVAGQKAGLPDHAVAPHQGALLAMLAKMVGAKRILEIGTLAGYSTLYLAEAVGESGHVVTLEIDHHHAAVAQQTFVAQGVSERIRLIEGAAVDSLRALAAENPEPFDMVFIDADKPNNVHYLDLALRMVREGSVIVVDNIVRDGAVVDATSSDDRVRGSRAAIEAVAAHASLEATALQTVGMKGWDGFLLARVTKPT